MGYTHQYSRTAPKGVSVETILRGKIVHGVAFRGARPACAHCRPRALTVGHARTTGDLRRSRSSKSTHPQFLFAYLVFLAAMGMTCGTSVLGIRAGGLGGAMVMDTCVGAIRRPSVAQTAGSETRAEQKHDIALCWEIFGPGARKAPVTGGPPAELV